ncbi:MAG TPA: von Willebrand factor type A domain-containing protein [Verrucomicrobiales bacterium]|nr:von Willebrand factor type A domain-containing protein [Verrucomicrobiales bacterium]
MNAEISPETSDPRAIATAWALDELTPEERAAFEQQIENDSELAALAEETKAFCGVLSGSLGHPTLELQEAARSRLLFEADRPRREAKVVRATWIRRLTTMAACFAAGSAGTWWFLDGNTVRNQYAREPASTLRASAKDAAVTSSGVRSSSYVTPVNMPASGTSGTLLTDEQSAELKRRWALALGYQDLGKYKEAEGEFNHILSADPTDSRARRGLERVQKRIADYDKAARDETRLRMLEGGVDTTPTAGPVTGVTPLPEAAHPVTAPATPPNVSAAPPADFAAANVQQGDFLTPRPASGPSPANAPENHASGYSGYTYPVDTAQTSGANGLAHSAEQSKPVTRTPLRTERGIFVPAKPASTTPSAAAGAATLATTVPSRTSADALTTGDFDHREGAFAYVAGESRELTAGESYAQVVENPFRTVLKEPLSTFSTDVDTASYANVRRFLNMGQCPPPAAVRLEELVNYFPYDYAPPTDGKPFAVHVEMTSAPWDSTHRIARIALKGKEIAQGERPAANLVFLVDVSGSMDTENKLPLVKKSLKFVVERLTEKDTVSLVTYAGESGVALPATNGGDKQRISAAIDALRAGGSTNGAGGITTAYAQASQHFNKEGINRVILATDGDFNVGVTSNEDLLQLITDKAKSGTFLSVLGYGMGNTKDDRMELLADKGNGNYAYIDSLSEARKTLADQFNGTLVTIAKDVKVQIEFNPAVIRSYRLLGYENRMLAKEDFADDRKDAGEIGAGHTVTALYELVPVGVPDQPVNTTEKLKYQSKPEPVTAAPAVVADASGETMTVNLRWKAPDGEQSQLMEVPVKDTGAKISQSSPETRWAVAVAGFASLLNNSRHAGLSWEDVRVLARSAKGTDANGYRGEFLQLLDKAASVRPTERQ